LQFFTTSLLALLAKRLLEGIWLPKQVPSSIFQN